MRDLKILVMDDDASCEQLARCRRENVRILRATNAESMETLYSQNKPDVAIIGGFSGQSDDTQLVERLRRLDNDAKIIVFTACDDPMQAIKALQFGACGYVTKAAPYDELLLAIDKVSGGGCHIEHRIAMGVIFCNLNAPERGSELTQRELDVLRQLGSARTFREISESLNVKPKTASWICSRIKQKLNLHTTGDLIRFATDMLSAGAARDPRSQSR